MYLKNKDIIDGPWHTMGCLRILNDTMVWKQYTFRRKYLEFWVWSFPGPVKRGTVPFCDAEPWRSKPWLPVSHVIMGINNPHT